MKMRKSSVHAKRKWGEMKPVGGNLKPNHSFLACSLCPAQQLCLILFLFFLTFVFCFSLIAWKERCWRRGESIDWWNLRFRRKVAIVQAMDNSNLSRIINILDNQKDISIMPCWLCSGSVGDWACCWTPFSICEPWLRTCFIISN